MTFEEFIAATLPAPHTVVLSPCSGGGAYGDTFDPDVTVTPVYVEQKRRLARSADGSQVASTATVYAPIGTSVPDRSRVTLPDGREALVVQVIQHAAAGLDLPEHVEILVE